MSSIPNSAMPHAKAPSEDDQPRPNRFAKARAGAKSTLTGVLGLPITLGVVGAAMVVRVLRKGDVPATANREPGQLGTLG